jgi:hypothetical protein
MYFTFEDLLYFFDLNDYINNTLLMLISFCDYIKWRGSWYYEKSDFVSVSHNWYCEYLGDPDWKR